jgi:predicted metal-dependent hydrolase
MNRKAEKIAAMIAGFDGGGLDPHYAGYFDCFNRGLYYEAHDVLEQLWLPEKNGANGLFYKGLIQLAGAFVHLQKNRPGPAAALFKLARTNLANYPPHHQRLDVRAVLELIQNWLAKLEQERGNPLRAQTAPQIKLFQEAKPS